MRSQSARLAKKMQIAKDVSWRKRQWHLALAFLAMAVGLTCWIAYNGRRPVSPPESSTRPASTAVDPQAGTKTVEAVPEKATDTDTATATVNSSVNPARPRFQRVQVGKNEVDYINEDVTVRYFTHPTKPQRKPLVNGRVVYIGDDVTVRYFASTPAIMPDSH
jgi:cytoskeletal protein RodZ